MTDSVKRPERITIRHVAEQAGVSIQTVSRVLNDHPDVSDRTRNRVQGVIHALRFRPSGIARSMIARRTGVLGVIGSGFQHYGPSQLLAGIERQATALGLQLLLQVVHPSRAGEYERIANALLSQQVDGVIWAYPELTGDRERAFHEQIAPHAPIVFLSMRPAAGSTVICVDNRMGARLATEYMIAQGRRTIGLIGGPPALWSAQQRRLGWQDALVQARLGHGAARIVEGDWSAASGAAGLQRLLASVRGLDAVFAANDQMAMGALAAAHSAGLRIPDDLSVTGFDDIPEAPYLTPPLTTVHHDLFSLGQRGVRELQRMLEAKHAGIAEQGQADQSASILLEPSLMVRASA